jgi:hypothetical protein
VALVPAGVVTVTSTGLPVTGPGGAIALMDESEITVTLGEADGPNETDVAPEKPVPVICTTDPPPPKFGATDVTVGAGADPGRYE